MDIAPKARIAWLFLALLLPAAALADDNAHLHDLYDARYTITLPRPLATFDQRQPVTEEKPLEKPPEKKEPRFGDKSAEWASFSLGMAYNFADATDWNLRIAWSHFVVENVEFSVELNAWYFDQAGDNAVGINPVFLFRWHFLNTGDWTLYADAGIGLLFATDVVPERGTGVDFTPRVGGGFTYRLDDRGDRLQVGLRWHHISNARIEGDVSNPSRDAYMVYAGVMIPF